jgi:small-conductance mechanosensitive channel
MRGWLNLGKFAYGLLDGSRNALRHSPMEYRYLLSILLSAMWCVAFGIYTYELLYIGYNIIGHFVIITAVFFTFFVFSIEKKRSPKAPPNKVRWDLEREG